jgi:DNA mismatch repair protein MutS2
MIEHLNSFAKLEFEKIVDRIASHAATDLGKQAALNLRPLDSIDAARHSLRLVSEMRILVESGNHPPLEGITDCRQAIHGASAEGGYLTAPELQRIGYLLRGSRELKRFTKRHEGTAPSLSRFSEEIRSDKILEFNILSVISRSGKINDDASKELERIRGLIAEKRETLRTRLSSILKNLVKAGWAQDEIVSTREERLVIPLKVEHKQQVAGFIHSASASGLTVFLEPAETLDLNNDIRGLHFEEQREIERILRGLTTQVREKREMLLELLGTLAAFDTIYARALYSLALDGKEVAIGEGNLMILKKASHPLLLEKIGAGSVMPLDLTLGEENTVLVISGPNAGGKSVALKTIGLLTVMAHSGIHPSASENSLIPWISRIFVDIGDEQSIEYDLSTFTSHLLKLREITNEVDNRSLVLVDEICTGTDPDEGGALAGAILEYLAKERCLAVVTTHNTFIKAMASRTQEVDNASMEFDERGLSPTYRLRVGLPGSSFALEIANRIKLSGPLLSRARQLLGTKGDILEQLITKLVASERKLNEIRSGLEERKRSLRESSAAIERREKEIESMFRSLKSQAKNEARALVDEARSTIENLIREIREHQADRGVIVKAHAQLENLSRGIEELGAPEISSVKASPLSLNDYVRIKELGGAGQLVELKEDGTAIVLIGSSRLRVRTEQLERTGRIESTPLATTFVDHGRASNKIDVRGMFSEEAIGSIDKAIDNAILSGLNEIQIIHGKGTGSLRRKIREYLEKNPNVESFRTGEWNEGGMGNTIIQLRNS